MEREVMKVLLEQARRYWLLSKRAARAAKKARGPEREALEERARRLLQVSQDYFERAEALKRKYANGGQV